MNSANVSSDFVAPIRPFPVASESGSLGLWSFKAAPEPGQQIPILADTVADDFGLHRLDIDDDEEVGYCRKSQAGLVGLAASVGVHGLIIFLAVWFKFGQVPQVNFVLAPGSPYLAVDLVELASLGGGEPGEVAAPEVAPPVEEAQETPLPEEALPPEPAPPVVDEVKPFDLKPKVEPKAEPKPVPKKAAPKKKTKPITAEEVPPPGGVAPAGPGQKLGSLQGNAAKGGGGAGGTDVPGKTGSWQAVRVPEPKYPEAARRAGEHGRVLIMVVISPSGQVGSASIAQSSGFTRLDQAALSAAKNIRFKASGGSPPTKTVSVQIPYQFKLR